jgi:two-component system sensor histidine kinase KdpD
VFLGMAAGVGKTYRMLQEGHAEQDAGRDVVIGLLETHGRAETARMAVGLPSMPKRRVDYRGSLLEEMDLPSILVRAPELCLIDELAHTDAPGVEHEKRYEDVQDVLSAGIDVLSTVNVQHLESLNDQIAELSGVRVRETIPDAVLARADEVVLIDLSPEALLERLQAGKIYRPERIDAALNNFFRIENLSALREVALRQVAEEEGAKRQVGVASGRSRGCRGRRAGRRPLAPAPRSPARSCAGAHRAHDPDAVHRSGHLPARLRRGCPLGAGRARHAHAGLPGASAAHAADRVGAPGAVLGRDASPGSDRATGRRPGPGG